MPVTGKIVRVKIRPMVIIGRFIGVSPLIFESVRLRNVKVKPKSAKGTTKGAKNAYILLFGILREFWHPSVKMT